jgi:hypothetical protein
VRHAGARWRTTESVGMGAVATSPIVLQMPDGRGCNPVGQTYKRFTTGSEGDLASFYQALARDQ